MDHATKTADSVPLDMELRDSLQSTAHAAAEQATYHRVEAERHERVCRAAVAALEQLEQHSPVGECSPEQFFRPDSPVRAGMPG